MFTLTLLMAVSMPPQAPCPPQAPPVREVKGTCHCNLSGSPCNCEPLCECDNVQFVKHHKKSRPAQAPATPQAEPVASVPATVGNPWQWDSTRQEWWRYATAPPLMAQKPYQNLPPAQVPTSF